MPGKTSEFESSEMTFDRAEYATRLAAVREEMGRLGVDTLLVHTFANIFYLIGHQTTGLANYHCLVITQTAEPFLVVRRLEAPLAQACSWIDDFVIWEDHQDPAAVTVDALRERGLGRGVIGIDKGSISVSARFMELIQAGFAGAVFKDAGGLVEHGRRIKSPAEIAYLRRAAEMTSLGMQAAINAIEPGATENDVAAAAVSAMYRAGSEFMSREPTVTSGPRSGIAHTTFKRRLLEQGDAVLMEMSACYNRYNAPMMRVASIGEPSAQMQSWAEACLAGLEGAIAAVKPGNTAGDVEAAVSDAYRAAGLSAGKRAGYSVGIGFPVTWMEADIIALKREDPTLLEPGMVFHIVPALREFRKFSVGCSETVLVTETGSEILTRLDRKVFVL